MRQTVFAVAVAFVIGGVATGAVLSHAQPAPGAQVEPGRGPPGPHPWMGWGHHPRPGMAGRWGGGPIGGPVGGMRAFALVYRQEDRALAPADVQKIAEAFLLWNGNHSWKIANVASTSDGLVEFSVTTQDGSVVAKFTMDPHTGKAMRIG